MNIKERGVRNSENFTEEWYSSIGDMSVREDVLIDGEKIVKVGRNLEAEDAQVVDVNGKLLFPGFIDGHTHFDLEVAGTVTADDFETGTRAAIAGGTTLVIDYASQDKGGHTLRKALRSGMRKQMGNVPVIILSICLLWNGMRKLREKYKI